MANYEQAPILKRKGVKERSGLFAYRPLELEAAMCCCLGDRDMVALKTMLFFTGNSNDGDFRVAQKTIFDRMNISEKPYYLARKKLQAMGWIEYVEAENAIYINYDRIYADYKEYLKNATGGANSSPKANSIQESAVLKENADRLSDNHEGSFQDSQQGGHQDGYNNSDFPHRK